MKRIAVALMATAAVLSFGSGVSAQGRDYPPGRPPTVSLSSPSPAAGAQFTVTANGCPAGATASFEFQGQTASGSTQTTFTAPTAAGTYAGSVTCGGTTVSFSVNVAPTAPNLPATGGGSSSGTTTSIAAMLLLAGVGMFGVAQVRRRQAIAT